MCFEIPRMIHNNNNNKAQRRASIWKRLIENGKVRVHEREPKRKKKSKYKNKIIHNKLTRNKKHTKPIWPIKRMDFQLCLAFSQFYTYIRTYICVRFSFRVRHVPLSTMNSAKRSNILEYRIFDVLIKSQSTLKIFLPQVKNAHMLCAMAALLSLTRMQKREKARGKEMEREGERERKREIACNTAHKCYEWQLVELQRSNFNFQRHGERARIEPKLTSKTIRVANDECLTSIWNSDQWFYQFV